MAHDKQHARPNPDASEHSMSPAGEQFVIPTAHDHTAEFERIEKLVQQARREGKEIVVVMGVGFVGAVMAAIIADTQDEKGKHQVCHRMSAAQYAKLLEDPPAQSRRVTRQGRGPRSK